MLGMCSYVKSGIVKYKAKKKLSSTVVKSPISSGSPESSAKDTKAKAAYVFFTM